MQEAKISQRTVFFLVIKQKMQKKNPQNVIQIGKKKIFGVTCKHRLEQKFQCAIRRVFPLSCSFFSFFFFYYCELLISLRAFSLSILTFCFSANHNQGCEVKDAARLLNTDVESTVYMAFVFECASATYIVCMQKYIFSIPVQTSESSVYTAGRCKAFQLSVSGHCEFVSFRTSQSCRGWGPPFLKGNNAGNSSEANFSSFCVFFFFF